ncbi:uncharacterized protein ATC70_005437 [Mucor velutinosus]|uniref:Uncharacterized protein n=1 Tax=Mucor velutinosus TaxID=708070 RepID=A0AAN7D9H7_9FUNG|nr:hypothetical protein ATC70_005437 [Mucor velutinosus]
MDFYDHNIRPHYGNKPKKPTKKYATLYEINDGRTPNNNTALFGTKKRKQEVVFIGDAEEDGKRKAKKAKTCDVSLDAVIIEHLDETDEMERDCLKMDDFPDDDISDEKLFLELLSDDECKSGKAEIVFDRTENLDEDIKDMFDDLGIPVEDVVGSDEELKASVIDLVSSSSFSSSSSSSLMKTKCKSTSVLQHKSEPTSSKMRALSDSDFSLPSPPSNSPFPASDGAVIDLTIQDIQKSVSDTVIDLCSPPMPHEAST